MIWDDPWIAVATDHSGPARRFCTLLPPPRPTLPAGLTFDCLTGTDIISLLSEWRDLVGTAWSLEALVARLVGAWVAVMRDGSGALVGTCVLRSHRQIDGGLWLLETLRARHGVGTPLMRSVMTWIWDRAGPFMLGFTWELTAPQLAVAWWRGWLAAAAAVQFGWSWRRPQGEENGCLFCPSKDKHHPLLMQPSLVGDAVVTDSGLGDGWGYVLTLRSSGGSPDWNAICERGGWKNGLWMRSTVAPPGDGWRPTGEIVVVGLLNCWDAASVPLEWITAEISHR
jgi:hypothetical protein